jgi:hypothetical protein
MRGYPYGADQHYPTTTAHRDYQERYNTRVVSKTVESEFWLRPQPPAASRGPR